LRADAEQYASPTWNSAFFDSIAAYVPNMVKSTSRITFKAQIALPTGAKRPLAILSKNKSDFQDSAEDTKGLQFWAEVGSNGYVEIPRVAFGTYRLTVFADGVFGQYEKDNVVVSASTTGVQQVPWVAESAGTFHYVLICLYMSIT